MYVEEVKPEKATRAIFLRKSLVTLSVEPTMAYDFMHDFIRR